jgi:invasion protein IalB
MFKKTKALPLLLALALAPAAGAQTTTPPAKAPAATSPDMGTPAAGQDTGAIGSAYVESTVGDWLIRCVHAPGGHDPCQIYQLMKDQSGNPVAEIAISALPPGQPAAAGATIVTPLETLLPRGVTLKIDSQPAKVYSFLFCNPKGCIANVGFTAQEVDAMKKGSEIALSVIPVQAPDQPVELKVSLKGFTAGLEKAAKLNKEHKVTPAASAPAAPSSALPKTMPKVPSIAPKSGN